MVGNITQPNGLPLANKNSKIYLLDIRNYTWVYTFEPSTPSNTSSTLPTSNPSISNTPGSNNTAANIAIGTLSGIFGTAILMTMVFFGYRWYKIRRTNNQNEVLIIFTLLLQFWSG